MIFQPTDNLIGPIIHQLSLVAQQVAGVIIVYEEPPDHAPEDGSVQIPMAQFKIVDDTNGKLKISLMFPVRYNIIRGSLTDNIITAYTYVMPFLQAFSAWSNQTLGGLAIEVCPKAGGVTQAIMSGQVVVCLVTNVEVLTEFNIPVGV